VNKKTLNNTMTVSDGVAVSSPMFSQMSHALEADEETASLILPPKRFKQLFYFFAFRQSNHEGLKVVSK
jgi:hypothetical protein